MRGTNPFLHTMLENKSIDKRPRQTLSRWGVTSEKLFL